MRTITATIKVTLEIDDDIQIENDAYGKPYFFLDKDGNELHLCFALSNDDAGTVVCSDKDLGKAGFHNLEFNEIEIQLTNQENE